jgi:hypothetical protein
MVDDSFSKIENQCGLDEVEREWGKWNEGWTDGNLTRKW